jgi:outer membrane protein W
VGIALFGVVGAGSFGDDEGSLGAGWVGGGGASARVADRVRLEVVVTTTHHSQVASISWEGRPTVVTGRALYLFGALSSRIRPFAGVGAGGGHYAGTRTDTVFEAPGAPPRSAHVSFDVTGLAAEIGGGMEVGVGSRVFVRPEAWLLMMGGEPTAGLEPAFVMPRAGVSAGVRFWPEVRLRADTAQPLVYCTAHDAVNTRPGLPGTSLPTLPSPCARWAGSALTLTSIR